MNRFADWTLDQLETELARIDAKALPLSTATMMRRNELWLEIERRTAAKVA